MEKLELLNFYFVTFVLYVVKTLRFGCVFAAPAPNEGNASPENNLPA